MHHDRDSLTCRLAQLGATQNEPLRDLTSFHVGGNAAYLLRPRAYTDIETALRLCRDAGLPVQVLGRGSNMLASDAGFDGLILRLDTPLAPLTIMKHRVFCCAFMPLTQLCKETAAAGLSGLERLCGIPGTVGGACAMNAGAYGGEISQVLRAVQVLRDGVIRWETVRNGDLGYRKSAFSYPDCIVLMAEFELAEGNAEVAEVMHSCLAQRREKQPLNFPSAGSVFKRPMGNFAGKLIEDCGLKGYSIGGAQVSPLHAGFIVNTGGATETDISALIAHIQATVLDNTGETLECEVKRLLPIATKDSGGEPCIC